MTIQDTAYRSEPAVYVYEAPIRIWHWVNALAITVLCVTGYFIGSPLPTVAGALYRFRKVSASSSPPLWPPVHFSATQVSIGGDERSLAT